MLYSLPVATCANETSSVVDVDVKVNVNAWLNSLTGDYQ